MQVQMRGKNLDKKLWLARYRELRDEADEWKDESDRLRNQLFPSASIITGMPRNPSPKPVDEIWSEHIAAITECKHTDDIRHAANFEIIGGDMWEKETELATLEQASDDDGR